MRFSVHTFVGLPWRWLPAPLCAGMAITACAAVLVAAAPAAAVELRPGDIIAAGWDVVGRPPPLGVVARVDPVTGEQTVITSGGNLESPFAVAVEPSGSLLVFDGAGDGSPAQLVRVDPATGAQIVLSSGEDVRRTADITVSRNGDIYAVDYGLSVVRIDPVTGGRTVVATTGPELRQPSGLAFDPAGRLIVGGIPADEEAASIIRLDLATGARTLLATFGLPQDPEENTTTFAGDIAIEPDGDILLSGVGDGLEDGPGSVFRIDSDTGAVTTVSAGGLMFRPFGLAVGLDGSIIAADYGRVFGVGSILRIDPETGAQAVLSSGGPVDHPFAVAVYVPEPAAAALLLLLPAVLFRPRRINLGTAPGSLPNRIA